MRRRGYILIETIGAMAILSISMMAIYGAVRQAIITRGQAQDYTTARFLLEQVAADREVQRELDVSSGSGAFPEPNERFHYDWKIERVELKEPDMLPKIASPMYKELLKQYQKSIGRMEVRVTWTRAGMPFEARAQTLLRPRQLWEPPKVE